MCGIAGAVRNILDREAVERPRSERLVSVVERISESQRHRGPDGVGLWQSRAQEVVFAHRRLAILDLSEAGAQPMIDVESGCAITFNGEMYNFLEVRRDLESLGEVFRSTSDTEVILKAYKRWGLASIPRFRGIFAFALWDPRSRTVHLVRDPMGVKPLYWTASHDTETGEDVVLFASELRALLASRVVPRRLNASAVASYLWHGFVVGPETVVEDVHLLPASTIMTIGSGGATLNSRSVRRYWEMPGAAAEPTSAEEVREELLRTVKMQLVSDVPLGIFLSGGIDSSAVATLATDAAPGSVHTFTVGFDLPEYDERQYAQSVATALASHHTTLVLTERSFQEQLPAAIGSIDQPTFDGINTYFVSRAAREAGMTVALAGTGGDELFGGYRSYVDVPRALRVGSWLPTGDGGTPRGRAFHRAVGLAAHIVDGAFWRLLQRAPPQTRWGKAADVLRAMGSLLGLYQTSYCLFTRESQAVLAGEDVRAAQGRREWGLPPDVAAAWRRRVEGVPALHGISLLELSSFIGERLLRDTDAASMAVSLEARVPLLDHRLAESVAGLDPRSRFFPLGRKQLLRDLALARLDPAIFERPKAGFVLPIDTWARRRLQPEMEALLSDPEAARQAGLRGESVRTLWRSFLEGRGGIYWSRVWALYVLLSWCRSHEVSSPS